MAADIEELNESERLKAHLAAIVNSSDDAIISKNLYGIVESWNRGAEKIFGYKAEEIVGKSITILIPTHLLYEEKEILESIRNGKPVEHYETIRRRKDGELINLSLTVSPIKNNSGVVIGASKIARDITESKKAEQALRESEEKFAKAFNSSPLTLSITSLKTGKLIEVNDTLLKVTGYTREELIGRTTAEIGLWSNPTDRETELTAVQQNREIRDLEFNFRVKDGRKIVGLLSAELLEIRGEPCALTVIQDITQRRKNEEIIRQSAKQLAFVTDIAPVFIVHCDREKRFKFVNKTYAERFGLKPEECIGKPIEEIIGKPAFDKIREHIETVLQGNAVDFELEVPYEKIGTYFMHCSYAPEFDENGAVVGFVAAMTDISERRKMERAFQESEKQLRLMADSMPQVVWIADAEGNISYYNNRVSEFSGVVKQDDGSWNWQPLIHPDDKSATLRAWRQATAKKQSYAREHRIQMANGKFRWHLSRAFPVFDENGEIFKWYGTATDIHDLKETQNALLEAERRASEEYLELLSRIVPLGQTLGTSRNLNAIYRVLLEFVYASMPCMAFFVSSFDAENNLRIAEYAWGENGELDLSLLPPMPLIENGGPNSQAVFEKKSVVTSSYWDLMKKRPHVVLNENGKNPNSSIVVPMLIMNRVIGTLEVQAYEESAFTNEHIIALEMAANLAAVAIENVRLLQVEAGARETAEAANRAKDEFLSVLSHELRTPLNSMLGWTRMLRVGMLDEEKTARGIEVIERNTLLQKDLIEDLLDVSRIISGKMRIDKETVDLRKVFNHSMEVLRPFAMQKNISFEPQSSEQPLIINGDETRIQQIISNLVQNAFKFTEDGGTVVIWLTRSGDVARLVVKDSGIGIGAEVMPHIFERFRQADSSTKRTFTGLGLGLTIVNNLVELHGGTVKAESEGDGQGATFTVEIPLIDEFVNHQTD